ncbi:MAG: peptidoglycan DD-metalloendopeptidase family protein [Acidimicrobiia bacterium]
MNRTPTRIIAAIMVLGLAMPAIAAVTDEDLRRAGEEIDRIMGEAQELGDEVQAAWARQLQLEAEIKGLEESINHAQLRLAETERRLEVVAVEMYMATASGVSMSILMHAGTGQYQAGLQYLRKVNGSDQDLVNQLRVLRTELDRQTGRLGEASAEQTIVTAELEEMAAALQAELAEAQVFYDQLTARQRAEEEERRRQEEARIRAEAEARRRAETSTTSTTSPAATTSTAGSGGSSSTSATTTTAAGAGTTTTPADPPVSGGVCPVAGPVSFSNTWGAPRSGGRSHQGVDMIAARGTPAVAIFEGTIYRITTVALGGLSVWLSTANGDRFYYAHLDSYGDISVGKRVAQGFVVGYVGTSGNAPAYLPHLHFEYHPGGGAAVNPYPLVRSIC